MQNTMSNGKEFPISAIVSAVTGFVLPHSNPQDDTNNMDEVADVISFMVGESLFSHALVRGSRAVEPYVMEWYPQIGEIKAKLQRFKAEARNLSDGGRNNTYWREKWALVTAEYGSNWMLWQIPQDDFESKDPVQEWIDMGGNPDAIINLDLSEDDDISPYGDLPSKN